MQFILNRPDLYAVLLTATQPDLRLSQLIIQRASCCSVQSEEVLPLVWRRSARTPVKTDSPSQFQLRSTLRGYVTQTSIIILMIPA